MAKMYKPEAEETTWAACLQCQRQAFGFHFTLCPPTFSTLSLFPLLSVSYSDCGAAFIWHSV